MQLTTEEEAEALLEGNIRYENAKKAGYKPAHGCKDKDALRIHLKGSPGEKAGRKLFHLCLKLREGNYKEPDMGTNTDVRTVDDIDHCLYIRWKDADCRRFISMLNCGDRWFLARGWFWAWEAKQHPEWWRSPDPTREECWCVPRKKLYPMSSLTWL